MRRYKRRKKIRIKFDVMWEELEDEDCFSNIQRSLDSKNEISKRRKIPFSYKDIHVGKDQDFHPL